MAQPLPIVRSPQHQSAAPILGIDLGTTFSLAAWLAPDGPRMVRDDSGDARVPSAIVFGKDGRVTVGWEARAHLLEDPEHSAYSVKRLVGKSLAELEGDLAYVPFQVIERQAEGGRRSLHVRIDDREYTPEELSAIILRDVVLRARRALGKPVERAVITVPAYFDEAQRQATRDAGRIAGLDVVRIINEPTAAALAYGLHRRDAARIAVYDLGGGTFDCSILQLREGAFKVLSTHGDTRLGGDDFDAALMDVFKGEFIAFAGDFSPIARQALRDGCERLKHALSATDSSELVVKLPDSGDRFVKSYSRAEFESLIEPLVERTLQSCRRALKDAGLKPENVDETVLVGGSTRVPLVRRRVAELFGKPPHDEINPDEAVALGAAVQAGILAGQLKETLLLDIAPLSLGIETLGGAVGRLIPRNSAIPARATERFTTFVDGQTSVDIHVLQGERELAKDCRSLGRFRLSGLPPMPAGAPQIDVTFLLDASGMLQVTAAEARSGKAAAIDVSPSYGLDRGEVDRLVRESVEHAREDFAARRLVELRNRAEGDLRHAEKALERVGKRLDSARRAEIETARAVLDSVRSGDDLPALQAAVDRFDVATRPLAEILMGATLAAEAERAASDAH